MVITGSFYTGEKRELVSFRFTELKMIVLHIIPKEIGLNFLEEMTEVS